MENQKSTCWLQIIQPNSIVQVKGILEKLVPHSTMQEEDGGKEDMRESTEHSSQWHFWETTSAALLF